jgi:trehalose 6-phosphate synthase
VASFDKLLIVSNTAPIPSPPGMAASSDGAVSGSLLTTLDRLARTRHEDVTWLAVAIQVPGAAGFCNEPVISEPTSPYSQVFLRVNALRYQEYWEEVATKVLWTAFHDTWVDAAHRSNGIHVTRAWTRAYETVNADLARLAVRHGTAQAAFLFHDHHVAIAPAMVRALRPGAAIGHFTHTAFPRPESLQKLPPTVVRRLIAGMLGADLLAFHTPVWCDAFLDVCDWLSLKTDRRAGYVQSDQRRVWVRPYPLPIDTIMLRRHSREAAPERWAALFRRSTKGALVVRSDRTDPAKNILRGFDAFERLLDGRPDLRATHFVASLHRARQSIDTYRAHSDHIQARVNSINERYPKAVSLFLDNNIDRSLGAFIEYDVHLVNALNDGMNLVSQEGAALNRRDGVLVMSRRVGAFSTMGADTIAIADPTSTVETASALARALDMAAPERARRARNLRALVERSHPTRWLDAQLTDLWAITHGGEPTAV